MDTVINDSATKIDDKEEDDDVSNSICLTPKLLQKPLRHSPLSTHGSKRVKQMPLVDSSRVAQEPAEEVPTKELEEQATERGISEARNTFRSIREPLACTSASPSVSVEPPCKPAESEPSRMVLNSPTFWSTGPTEERDLSSSPCSPIRNSIPFLSPIQALAVGNSCMSPDRSLVSSSNVAPIPASELDCGQLIGRFQSMKEKFDSLREGVHPFLAEMKAKVKVLLAQLQADPSQFQGFDALVNGLSTLAQLVPPAHHDSVKSLKGMVERVQLLVRTFREKAESLHTPGKDVPQVLSLINDMCDKAQQASTKVASIEAERSNAFDDSKFLKDQIAEFQAQLCGVKTRLSSLDSELIPARKFLEETRQEIATKLPTFEQQLNTAKHSRATLDHLLFDLSFYAKSALDYSSFLDLIK